MARLLVLFLLVGCGAASAGSTRSEPPREQPVADPHEPVADPGPDIDPQPCDADADCMIGTPRDCCTSFCPEDRQAWSRARWADYQSECAVIECTAEETLACRPEPLPEVRAICRAGRCVLTEP